MNEPRKRAVLAYAVVAGAVALVVGSLLFEGADLVGSGAYGLWLVTMAAVGGLIAARKPDNAVGWIVLSIGTLGAAGSFADNFVGATLPTEGPTALVRAGAWIGHWIEIPAFGLLAFLLLLFPTGHLLGPRWRSLAWVAGVSLAVGTAAVAFYPGPLDALPELDNPLGFSAAEPALDVIRNVAPFAEIVAALAGIASLVIRFRGAQGIERRQIAWLTYAAAILLVTLAFAAMATDETNDLSFFIAMVGLLGVPVAIGIAMLRHRLYDIDVVVNRTIVYAGLTACVVAFYILIVGSMGALLQRRVSLIPALIATGIVAIAFQPLRGILQSMVDRAMYGDRKDPYAALAELGKKLEAAFSPEDVLPSIVDTVSRSLKVPYVSIDLGEGPTYRTAASVGSPTENTLELPLLHQGSRVGRLVVGERRGDELSRADKSLLEDLARQGGVAAHAVQLTEDLRRSREELLATREEERRRIRRDLHDGLGPELAGIALGLGAARNNMRTDAATAAAQLAKLEAQVKEATRVVRDLVEGLRPPTLDELGLVGAIRQKAAVLNSGNGAPQLTVDAPDDLPTLPAAVEVAALRITLEALTNATRHSGATTCTVQVEVGDDLIVRIEDDGRGIADDAAAGVGLTSMKERASELGGSLAIDARSPAGTMVTATLPLGPT